RATLARGQGEEPLPYPAPPPLGMHGEVGDVDLVADLPQADVADHALPRAHHRAAGDLVLLDLVAEGGAGPRGDEGHALDGKDLVEVGLDHGRRGQLHLYATHPRRALSSASAGRRWGAITASALPPPPPARTAWPSWAPGAAEGSRWAAGAMCTSSPSRASHGRQASMPSPSRITGALSSAAASS